MYAYLMWMSFWNRVVKLSKIINYQESKCHRLNRNLVKISFLTFPGNMMFLGVTKKTEAATQRCSKEKFLWKYAANLQENTMLKCDFNKVAYFIEITLRHGHCPVNLQQIFRKHFTKNTSGRLLLKRTLMWNVETTFKLKYSNHHCRNQSLHFKV